jgi:hypothetical protein
MPNYREGNKPYKVELSSELERTITPAFMRPGSTIVARDGVVYERMKDGSLRCITRSLKKRGKRV